MFDSAIVAVIISVLYCVSIVIDNLWDGILINTIDSCAPMKWTNVDLLNNQNFNWESQGDVVGTNDNVTVLGEPGPPAAHFKCTVDDECCQSSDLVGSASRTAKLRV